MSPRFQLDESAVDEQTVQFLETSAPPPAARHLLEVDWDGSEVEPLMLYVAEEPRVGLEFAYHGLDWQIVEYDDGWIARMIVD